MSLNYDERILKIEGVKRYLHKPTKRVYARVGKNPCIKEEVNNSNGKKILTVIPPTL